MKCGLRRLSTAHTSSASLAHQRTGADFGGVAAGRPGCGSTRYLTSLQSIPACVAQSCCTAMMPISTKKGRRTVRVLQWCSAVAAEKSTDKLMLIAVNNSKDVLADHHALAIDTIAAWSFNVAAENKFPMCDHEGVAFKATSHRGRLALDGRQLCA